jgi:hypothetical protein
MVVGDAAERVQAVQPRSQRTLIVLGLFFFVLLMACGAIGMALIEGWGALDSIAKHSMAWHGMAYHSIA